MKLLNLLLGISYIIPKMLSSEFQSNSIKIEYFKIDPLNPFNPITTMGWSEMLTLLLEMSYNMTKMFSSKF